MTSCRSFKVSRRREQRSSEKNSDTYFETRVFFSQTIKIGFGTWFVRIITSILEAKRQDYDHPYRMDIHKTEVGVCWLVATRDEQTPRGNVFARGLKQKRLIIKINCAGAALIEQWQCEERERERESKDLLPILKWTWNRIALACGIVGWSLMQRWGWCLFNLGSVL